MAVEHLDQELGQLLLSLCSADGPQRSAAEATLEGVRLKPGFATRLAVWAVQGPATQDAMPLRQMALTILRKLTQRQWSELSAPDQDGLRTALLQGLTEKNTSLQGLLFACIANVQAAGEWPALQAQLSAGILQGNSEQAAACVECAAVLLDSSAEVVQSLGHLQAPLLQLASSEASAPELRRSCIRAHVSSVTSLLASSSGEGVGNAVLSALPAWLGVYGQLCEGPGTWEPAVRVRCAFTALQAVTSLCRFPELEATMAQSIEGLLRPACLLVQSLHPAYEQAVVLADDGGQSEEEGGLAAFVAQTMELIQAMAVRAKLKPLLKNRVKSLLQLLVPFMRITENQAASWRADPNEFLVQEEDEHCRGCTIRLSGEGLVGQMLESFKREGSRAVAALAADLLERGETIRSSGDATAWKLTEVGLFIFSIGVGEATVKSLQRSELGPLVPDTLALAARLCADRCAPEFLRARAFSLLHRLGDTVSQLAREEIPQLLEAAAKGLGSDEPLVVRVSACRVFCRFLTATHDDQLREELLLRKGVLASLGSLLRDADEELLHLCLECLCIIVKQCPNVMAAVSHELCPLTVQIWRRCAADPMVHMQVLDLVSCCVGADKQLQVAMEESLLPVVAADLTGSDPHLASSAIELLGVLLKRAAVPFGPAMCSCVAPLVAKAMESDESMMLQNSCETLVSLVERSPSQVVEANLLEPLLRLVERLLGPDLEDDACLYVGPLAMLLFAQFGRALPVALQVGLLRALVTRLARAERPYLRQELVVVCARLIHEDLNGAVAALAGVEVQTSSPRSGLELLLSAWLACAPDIRAKRARNVTVSAMCRMHEQCFQESSPLRHCRVGEAPLPDQLLQVIVAGLEFENDRFKRLREAEVEALKSEEEEDDDDEDEPAAEKGGKFLSDFLDLEDLDSEGSDAGGDTFQDLERKDPLCELDLQTTLAQYLAKQEPREDPVLMQRIAKSIQEANSFGQPLPSTDAANTGGYMH